MKKITAQIKINTNLFSNIEDRVKNISDFKNEIEKVLAEDTTNILSTILSGAIVLNASDIHIEPEKENVKIRVRIDGMLHDVIFIDFKIYGPLVSRIKLLSGTKLNITKKAQDGRFTILVNKKETEIRTSVLPCEYQESIVMRILSSERIIEIEKLGIRKDILEQFKKEIKKPNGMIIVTGPTGSGKTTTLYSVLKKIQKPEIKIITIEDPIEYHLRGISQTQVAPEKGYAFLNGLKSIVRQDPDVILVGEIRDAETVKIAMQAALTGHLVLTTLHTNDTAGTIARLQSLGGKPINISPALNIVIAQRLVRKVCKKCVKFSAPTEKEMKILKKELKPLEGKLEMPKINKDLKIARAQGCPDCNFTGYDGRIGIFEFFLKDDEMENIILKSPSVSDLRKIARKKGMVLMREDGLIKVLKGETTIEEIDRTTRN
jgi:type II secretory ATPase GspE/PulE/Tfp pilus assembly ATPase PilB-like protein